MQHITNSKEIPNGLVLIDFYATWCGPCKMLAPVLEQVTQIEVVKVNIDEAEQLTSQFNISVVPTLVILNGGKEIARRSGFCSLNELNNWISENK